jgi:hypothetical protein
MKGIKKVKEEVYRWASRQRSGDNQKRSGEKMCGPCYDGRSEKMTVIGDSEVVTERRL